MACTSRPHPMAAGESRSRHHHQAKEHEAVNAEQQREWEDDDLRRAALERAERAEERLRTSRQGGQAMNKVRDFYAEEVDFLLSCGEPPLRIAERLGVKPLSLSRSLYRAERPDIAKLFGNAAAGRQHPRGECADCGQPIMRRSKRCMRCASKARWAA